jgi:hypothetical protein
MGLSTDTKTGEPEYPHVERNSTAKLSCGGVFRAAHVFRHRVTARRVWAGFHG